MKILHLVSNWKLTGPVAPALELAGALRARGHDLDAAVGRPAEDKPDFAADHARQQGLDVVGEELRLSKHFRMIDNFRDIRRLRAMVQERGYDLLHVHGTNDHLIASAVRRGGRVRFGLVRSFYGGTLERIRRRDRLLTVRAAQGVVVPSYAEEEWARQLRPDLAATRVVRFPGAVDLQRFDPERVAPPPRPDGAFRVGIVARVQTHRRWEDLLEALRRLVGRGDPVKLVVVGRGTLYEQLLVQPVKRMGLGDHVELAGYLTDDDYVQRLRSLDAAIYLVPGSDGTCRAVRELMALGLPMIVSRQGMLPELVEMGHSGMLLDGGGPEPIVEAMVRLMRNPGLAGRLAAASRARARVAFDPDRFADRVEALYREVLAAGAR